MGSCKRPLFFGRLARVLSGVALLVGIPFVPDSEYSWLGIAGLVIAGLTFFIAGARANPGCEITAIPNLFLPPGRQLACWCPLFSPLDNLERRLFKP